MRITLYLSLGLLLLANMTFAAEKKFTLRDYLNVQWTSELVTYPFEAPQGACTADSVTLAGPKGPLPVQLIHVEYWPGTTFVKSARVAFVADLAPLGNDVYTVSYGTKKATQPASDLKITTDADQVEVANAKFGVRLPLGEKTFPAPTSTAEVPGPVKAMRLADGTWFGGSRLYGARKITGYAAKLVESGPVLGKVEVRYTYEDGGATTLGVQLAAQNGQAIWTMDALAPAAVTVDGRAAYEKQTALKDGWEWLISPGITQLQLQTLVYQSYTLRWGKILTDKYGNLTNELTDVDLAKEPVGPLLSLLPWAGWWNQEQQSWFNFSTPGKGTILSISSLNPEEWYEPSGGPEMSSGAWNPRKWLKLLKMQDGTVLFQINNGLGKRKWLFGGPFPARAWKRISAFPNGNPMGVWPLDRVKDLVLDWPGDEGKHPRVFVTRADVARLQNKPVDPARIDEMLKYCEAYKYIDAPTYRDPNAVLAYLLTGSKGIADKVKLVERLRTYLGQLGNYDRMRQASHTGSMYDALIDSDIITPQERKVFRAQMAYLTYVCADAGNWSFDRGYASGNQNMTVAHVLNLGMLAATIPEHPMAKEWSQDALRMMEDWLQNSVGPNGEWPESMANYAEVSAAMIACYAVAAKNGGIHDFLSDPRFKKLLLYIARQYTPPDPRPFLNKTVPLMGSPPSGRGPAYHQSGISGLVAKATAQSDPEFSRVLQWHWMRGGQSTAYLADRLGGLEEIYMDPTLPAETPQWGSEFFPKMGAVLRQDVGSPLEYYVNFVVEPRGYVAYYSESGGFAGIWAKGAPISVRFAGHGYCTREELLISRVLPARETGTLEERKKRFMHTGPLAMTDFSALTRQDYMAMNLRMDAPKALWHGDQHETDVLPKWPPALQPGKLPIDWRRQVLFVKGKSAADATYLVFRDTVTGGQPTMWQFWTLSEKIGTPDEAKDVAKFLADKPGDKNLDARQLPQGDRYTAIGQQGVDVDYYIAAPTNTPRHTLRWGHGYYNFYTEFQDLLHLQLPGDGAYFVLLYPRKRGEETPTFQTLGNGNVIKVRGKFGTDYAFLANPQGTAEADGHTFTGTAGSIQERGGVILSLGAKGIIRHKNGFAIACETPVTLWTGDVMAVEWPAGVAGDKRADIIAPGAWALAKPVPGVQLAPGPNGTLIVTAPAGVNSVLLVKQ
ncbi:MAG: hypothetical protein ACYC7E_20420 [Armatimonadota bacterium]